MTEDLKNNKNIQSNEDPASIEKEQTPQIK